MTRKLLLPGQYHRRSVVSAPVADERGGPLLGSEQYIVELERLDGQWSAQFQWVDIAGQGHKVRLPYPVMAAILRQEASILSAMRKERARAAARTRKSKRGPKTEETKGG